MARPLPILCTCCGRLFRDLYSKDQAMGCATEVLGRRETPRLVVGSYGSRVADMTVYELMPHGPDLEAGTICDGCIVILENLGFLQEAGSTT